MFCSHFTLPTDSNSDCKPIMNQQIRVQHTFSILTHLHMNTLNRVSTMDNYDTELAGLNFNIHGVKDDEFMDLDLEQLVVK